MRALVVCWLCCRGRRRRTGAASRAVQQPLGKLEDVVQPMSGLVPRRRGVREEARRQLLAAVGDELPVVSVRRLGLLRRALQRQELPLPAFCLGNLFLLE